MYVVSAFGNSLLDITVKINDDLLLKKFNLQSNDQKEIATEQIHELYNEVSKYDLRYSAGGCAQNTLRVMQWLLGKPKVCLFFGAIANDNIGQQIKKLVAKDNLYTRYEIHENKQSGLCIALIKDENRALLANIGASTLFSIEYLKSHLHEIESSSLIYIEGYFLPNRLQSAFFLANFCNLKKKSLVFNLCGSYICEEMPEIILKFVVKSDIIFGNKNEFSTLASHSGEDDHLKFILNLFKNDVKSDKYNCRFGKTVVITNGDRDVTCIHGNGNVLTYEIPEITPEKIKDTTGAGDSFVSGFLTAYIRGLELKKCLYWANWTSSQIIKQFGCSIPEYLSENIE